MRIKTSFVNFFLRARILLRIEIRMARPATGATGKPTNLYMNLDVKKEGRRIAKTRYGISLSELVERLLRREMSLKRGLLNR